MNKKIKAIALAVSAAMLLSGCSKSSRSDETPTGNGGTPPGLFTPPAIISTANSNEIDPPPAEQPPEWTEDRGTMLSFSNSVLEIDRIKRTVDVAMGNDSMWTVFVYMCGADLESKGGGATQDIAEMEAATGECSKLRFVIEAGGSKEWHTDKCKGMMSQRLLVQNGTTRVLDSGNAKNMGSPDTLADFVSWGVENYASQYMVLDLWDHGGGSISGVCFDELFDKDSLSLEEIDTALASVFGKMTDRFEIIGFDACLMATVETANTLAPYGRYMVASQDVESFYGWNYGCFSDGVNSGAENGKEMGKYICDKFYESCTYTNEEGTATLSVIDLLNMDDFLISFNKFAEELYEHASSGGLTDIIKAAKSASNFGSNNKTEGYTNMIDLLSFVDLTGAYVSYDTFDALHKLKDDIVVYTRNGYYNYYSCGLSTYYPLSVQGSRELDIFRNISVSPYYLSIVDLCAYGSDNYGSDDGFNFDEWLEENSGFWNEYFDWDDNSYGYWNNEDDDNLNFDYSNTAITFIEEPHLNDDGYYYFRLTEESLDNLDTVYCNIMMSYWDDVDNCEYMLDLGTDDYVDLDRATGECYDSFDGYWFALPDGQPICVFLTDVFYDSNTGEYYNTYTAPIYINDEFTYLRIKQTYETGGTTTEILGAWDGISESGSADRDLYRLKAGDKIRPCYHAYDVITGEYALDFYGEEYTYTGNSRIGSDLLYDGDYYYAFEIYDMYNNAVYTDFVLFGVEEDGSIFYYYD